MRVLVLSTWFPYPPDNGARTRAYYLIRALAMKHEVTLLAFHPDNAPVANLPDNIRVVGVAADPFRHVNRSQWIKYVSPIPLAFWPSRQMQQAVDEVAYSGHWDVVVAIQTPVAQYATRLATRARVIDVDTSFSYQLYRRHSQHAGMRTWVSWQKTHQYEARWLRRFQVCSVVAAEEVSFVQSLLKGAKSNVAMVANGVDCQTRQPGQYSLRPNTLIYHGALTYGPNYDAMRFFLSEVYPLLRQQLPAVSLTITGSTAGVDRSGLQLDDSVQLSGYVKDIRPLVGSSAVCITPIREGSGTRLKILEAMALGVPVVSTHKGTEGLEVVDGEHVLLADDPAEFAARIMVALQDQAVRERLIVQARQLVERCYDWRTIGQQFVELVESAAQENKHQP